MAGLATSHGPGGLGPSVRIGRAHRAPGQLSVVESARCGRDAALVFPKPAHGKRSGTGDPQTARSSSETGRRRLASRGKQTKKWGKESTEVELILILISPPQPTRLPPPRGQFPPFSV